MPAWNDRIAEAVEALVEWGASLGSAASGYPADARSMLIAAGQTAGTETISIPTTAAVHSVFFESHSGDATITFPAASGGSSLHVHNGNSVALDLHGLLAGGDFEIGGTGTHYLITYVPEP